ncbi:MAG: tetratricopeptide repeat protein [Devosia sp.]
MRTLVRLFRSALAPLLAAALLALSLPALAEDAKANAALDQLFAQLRVAPDPMAARQIDQAIWAVWTNPSDPILNARMRQVLLARGTGNIAQALRLVDQLVIDYPDYAEGWNQRATYHYMMGDLDLSIADCARVLALEPRHFGALSGRALIYLQQGKRALALKDMAAALAVHPFLTERQLFPELDRPPATQI